MHLAKAHKSLPRGSNRQFGGALNELRNQSVWHVAQWYSIGEISYKILIGADFLLCCPSWLPLTSIDRASQPRKQRFQEPTTDPTLLIRRRPEKRLLQYCRDISFASLTIVSPIRARPLKEQSAVRPYRSVKTWIDHSNALNEHQIHWIHFPFENGQCKQKSVGKELCFSWSSERWRDDVVKVPDECIYLTLGQHNSRLIRSPLYSLQRNHAQTIDVRRRQIKRHLDNLLKERPATLGAPFPITLSQRSGHHFVIEGKNVGCMFEASG